MHSIFYCMWFTWQDFGSWREAACVATVRRCQKLPSCQTDSSSKFQHGPTAGPRWANQWHSV